MIEASRASINNVFSNPNEEDELYWSHKRLYGEEGTKEFFQYGIFDDNDLQKVPYTNFDNLVINAESIFQSIVSKLHTKKNEDLLKSKLVKIFHHLEEQHVIDSSKSINDVAVSMFTEYKNLIFKKVIKELKRDGVDYDKFPKFEERLKMTFDQAFRMKYEVTPSFYIGEILEKILPEKTPKNFIPKLNSIRRLS